jgi:hypothetical protein
MTLNESKPMIRVPQDVKIATSKAYKLRDLGFKGGLSTGWKRAKQLTTHRSIPIDDLREMRNWYARHFYTSYPSYKAWELAGKPVSDPTWYSRHGIIAWIIWGGTPAFRWVNSPAVLKLLNTHFDKQYVKIV